MSDVDQGGRHLFSQRQFFQAPGAVFRWINLCCIAQQFHQRIYGNCRGCTLLSQPICGCGLLLRPARLEDGNMARHFILNVMLRRRRALGAKTGYEKQHHSQAKTNTCLSEFTHGPNSFLKRCSSAGLNSPNVKNVQSRKALFMPKWDSCKYLKRNAEQVFPVLKLGSGCSLTAMNCSKMNTGRCIS